MRWMSHEIYAGFAKRLKQICDDKRLPERGRQAELARVCGVKPSSTNKWFNAVSLPDATNLLVIADWAKTSVDWLLTGRAHKEARATAEYSLVWISDEESGVLTDYRTCTDSGKRFVRDLLQRAEKEPAVERAVR